MDKPFRHLRDTEWQALLARATRKLIAADEVILREGALPEGMVIVCRGQVKACRDHGDFRIELTEHGPGEIFGEMSFLDSEPATVSVVAATEVEILFIGRVDVQAMVRENPGFFGRFFQSIAWICFSGPTRL